MLVLLRDLDAQCGADSSVQQASELAKAVQRQHQHSSKQATKQLPEDIHEGCVPVAVENNGGAQHSGGIQCSPCELATCKQQMRVFLFTAPLSSP